jgi:hypothetical protein
MWKRALLMLALALAVSTCRATALAAAAVTGTGEVRVVSVRLVPTTDSGPGLSSSLTYVVAQVELANNSPHDFTPEVSRFVLTSASHRRYQGFEGGASALVGVSNAHRILKSGDKRVYTVGFRASDPVVSGTISYEP